jgi:hypothetical protein
MLVKSLAFVAVAFGHGIPSSLLQLGSNAAPDDTIASIQKQVAEFKKHMQEEIQEDKEEVRKLHEQQRNMEKDEEAFKAKILTHRKNLSSSSKKPKSSFIEKPSSHFGDPHIDDAMRLFSDEIASEKRQLERLLSSKHAPESLAQQEERRRPELGMIASALKSRLAMVNRDH